ncbi:MAG: peptidoglycan-binding protein [Minisyncoccia bacterium]
MEKFKFTLLSLIILACLGIIGYWAVVTIEPGNAHFYKEKQLELEEKNRELLQEISELENEIALLKTETEQVEPTPTTPPPSKPPATTSSKHQSLINELQKLVDDNVFMKVGSKGTRVGSVQKFLNLYNKTSNKIDNDYGASMKTAVTNFQKAVGITADGETGPATYQKMIEWLKKQ